MNFLYTIDPNADEPEMVIDSHIGPDEVLESGEIIKGINGAQWARELLTLDSMGKRRVKVYINSPGGTVSDGYSICSAMLHTKCKVDTYCRGLAASIAGVAFMCGRTRCMADYSILMFHDPFGGNNNEALDKMKSSLATLIAARCGLTIETVSAIMARTTFLDVSEALELGMATETEFSTENNIGRLAPVKNDARKFWEGSKLIFNSILKIEDTTQKKIDMTDFKKINNRLGLMDEASAESREKALDAIINKSDVMNKKAEDAEKSLKAKEEEMAKMKADMEETAKKNKEAYDKMEAEFVKMKADMEEKEKTSKEEAKAKTKEEAKNLIEIAVKDGKIENKPEAIEKWTNKAESDFAGIKDLLSTMGVNRDAPDLSTVTGGNDYMKTKEYKNEADQANHMSLLAMEKMKEVKEANKRK